MYPDHDGHACDLFPYTDLSDILSAAQPALDKLLKQRQALLDEMEVLEQAGIMEAGYWYNKKDGLIIYHRGSYNGRKTEYIGKDPERVRAALAPIERFQRREELKNCLFFVELKLSSARFHLEKFMEELQE